MRQLLRRRINSDDDLVFALARERLGLLNRNYIEMDHGSVLRFCVLARAFSKACSGSLIFDIGRN